MRIISLLASATEIIAELGCLEQMVGRSHECDYPPEILHLPVISATQININTSSEQIDAQIKQLVQQKEAVQEDAFKALSICSSMWIFCSNCNQILSSLRHNVKSVQ